MQKKITEFLSIFGKRIILFLNYNKYFCSIFYSIFSNLFPLNTVYNYQNNFSLIQTCDRPLKSTKLSLYDMDFSFRLSSVIYSHVSVIQDE